MFKANVKLIAELCSEGCFNGKRKKLFIPDPSKFIDEANKKGEGVLNLFLKQFTIGWIVSDAGMAIVSVVHCYVSIGQIDIGMLYHSQNCM